MKVFVIFALMLASAQAEGSSETCVSGVCPSGEGDDATGLLQQRVVVAGNDEEDSEADEEGSFDIDGEADEDGTGDTDGQAEEEEEMRDEKKEDEQDAAKDVNPLPTESDIFQNNASIGEVLLSTEESLSGTGNCPYCFCTAASAAKCGTQAFNSIAKCGSSSVKNCDSRRRTDRRRSGRRRRRRRDSRRRGWGFKCNWNKIAKSCTLPKKCDFGLSPADCLSSFGSSLGSFGKTALNMIKDTKCKSFSSCKSKVEGGMSKAWSIFSDKVQDEVTGKVNGILNSVKSKLPVEPKEVIKQIKTHGSTVVAQAPQAVAAVKSYFDNAFGDFQPWDYGNLCSADGEGLWYMKPTDCGMFAKMTSLLSGNIGKSKDNFNAALAKLKQCVALKGMFNFPTPFSKVVVNKWCIPKPILQPFEVMVGSIVYVAAGVSTVMGDLVNLIKTKLQTLLSEAGLSLLGLGERLHAATKPLALQELGAEKSSAKKGSGFTMKIRLQTDVSYTITINGVPNTWTFSFGYILTTGQNSAGAPATPNLSFLFAVASGISKPVAVPPEPSLPEVGATIGLEFDWNNAPSWENRASVGATLDVVPSVEIPGVASVGIPISFGIFPSISTPSSITIEVAPSSDGDALMQTAGREIKADAAQAGREAEENGKDGLTAVLLSATHGLAHNTNLNKALDSMKSKINPDDIVRRAIARHQHGPRLVNAAVKHMQDRHFAREHGHPEPDSSELQEAVSLMQSEEHRGKTPPAKFDLTLGAGLAFDMCITECR